MMEKEEEDSYLEDNIFVMKNKSLEYDVVEVDDEAITVDTERDSGFDLLLIEVAIFS
jgi:hypothetical protein